MNQSVSSNPPFFLRLLSPFVCSCGPIKGSRIGFAKFFRRNTTPLRVWRFPRNPLGLETLPFQFAFYLCHRNNIRREGTKAVRSGNGFAHSSYSRSSSSRKRTKLLADWDYMLVKATRTERMRIRNRLSSPAILNAPSGFQFASEDSRFLSSADSRVCLIALSVSCTPTRL